MQAKRTRYAEIGTSVAKARAAGGEGGGEARQERKCWATGVWRQSGPAAIHVAPHNSQRLCPGLSFCDVFVWPAIIASRVHTFHIRLCVAGCSSEMLAAVCFCEWRKCKDFEGQLLCASCYFAVWERPP